MAPFPHDTGAVPGVDGRMAVVPEVGDGPAVSAIAGKTPAVVGTDETANATSTQAQKWEQKGASQSWQGD
jgi:hypothetical protein